MKGLKQKLSKYDRVLGQCEQSEIAKTKPHDINIFCKKLVRNSQFLDSWTTSYVINKHEVSKTICKNKTIVYLLLTHSRHQRSQINSPVKVKVDKYWENVVKLI